MKKIALVGATLALALVAGSATAANSLNAGTIGLNVPFTVPQYTVGTTTVADPLISGKYFISKDLAVLGGFGFATGGPSGATVTILRMMGGVKKYFGTNDFAPFVGGKLDYVSTSAAGTSNTDMMVGAIAGAEYFLAKQFSVDGTVGFGLRSLSAGGTSASFFGSATLGLSANFYF